MYTPKEEWADLILPTHAVLARSVTTAVLGTVLTYIQPGHGPRVQRAPVRLSQPQTHNVAPARKTMIQLFFLVTGPPNVRIFLS